VDSIQRQRVLHRRGYSAEHFEVLLTQVTAPLIPAQPVIPLRLGDPIPTTLFNSLMHPHPATVSAKLVDDVGSPMEFPKLSQALLHTITTQALRKVPPIFPDEPLYDADVLNYYDNICDREGELENVEDNQEQRLTQLGLTRSRLLSLKDNLDALGKLYAVDPAWLWELYDAKTMMVWIVAGAMYTSTSSTSGQAVGGCAGEEMDRRSKDSQAGASKSSASGIDSTEPADGRGGSQEGAHQRRAGCGGWTSPQHWPTHQRE
jgi:hypothetical protein